MQQQTVVKKKPVSVHDLPANTPIEVTGNGGTKYRGLARGVNRDMLSVLYTEYTTKDGKSAKVNDPRLGYVFARTPEWDSLVVLEDGLTPVQRFGALDMSVRVALSRVAAHVGSDPEIFIEDTDGNCIPAFTFLGPKTKDPEVGYWDGFQAEFSTRPSHCIAFHCDSVRLGLCNLYRRMPRGAKLSLKNVMWIPDEMRHSPLLAEEHVQFGCNPSKSAYGEPWMQYDGRTVPFRTAGGHIHLATREKGYTDNVAIAKNLDRFLGVIGVSMYRYWDVPERRELYGKAGEYRDTPYGIEYRTLSNAWLHSPWLMHFTFELARYGIGLCAEWEATEDEVRKCINTCDKDMAVNILARNMTTLRAILNRMPGTHVPGFAAWLEEVIMEGAHTKMVNPDVLSDYWKLDRSLGSWSAHSENNCATLSRVSSFLCQNGLAEKLQ